MKKRSFAENQGALYRGKAVEDRTIQPERAASIIKCLAVLRANGEAWADQALMLVYISWLTGAKIKDLVSLSLGDITVASYDPRGAIVASDIRVGKSVISVTPRCIVPIVEYMKRHELKVDPRLPKYSRNEYLIFHAENGTHCDVDKNRTVRWAQDTFKAAIGSAQIDRGYSISSLRNLHQQMMMEVVGANESLVDFLMGNTRYSYMYRNAYMGPFRSRAAQHFEKTMSDLGIV